MGTENLITANPLRMWKKEEPDGPGRGLSRKWKKV